MFFFDQNVTGFWLLNIKAVHDQVMVLLRWRPTLILYFYKLANGIAYHRRKSFDELGYTETFTPKLLLTVARHWNYSWKSRKRER